MQGCTYKEFIHFTINAPYYEFDFAVDILCSLFDEIELNSCEFNNEKKRIKAEIRENDERNSLDYFFNRIVWNGSEAEGTISGYCKVLDSISIKKINDFRKKILSCGNCFIYVTGNVSDDNMGILEEKIGKIDIEQKNAVFKNEVTVSSDFFRRDGKIKVKNGCWTYIKIGFDFESQKYPDGIYDLIYSILFSGDKSLVHNCLSEDNPMIYSFDSTQEQYDNIGNMNFKFEVQPDKIKESIETVIKILNDVKNGNFNFDANLKYEINRLEMFWDNPDDLNWNMAFNNHILKSTPIDFEDKYYGRFKDITKEQIMKAACEMFKLCNMTVAIKGDKRKIKAEEIEETFKYLTKESER